MRQNDRVTNGTACVDNRHDCSTTNVPSSPPKTHPHAPPIYRHAGNAKNGASGGDSHFLTFANSG